MCKKCTLLIPINLLFFYNLEVIISIGYRVKSKQGTQFRQWATRRLKDYLVKGHLINQKRLDQLQQTIQLISKNTNVDDLQIQEAKGLLDIIKNYTQSFILLNQYDSHSLKQIILPTILLMKLNTLRLMKQSKS
ncbi:MAG: RhuM family protein [Bacteroidota bacterium]